MASITFAANDELKSDISNLSWINLSALVKQELLRRQKRSKLFKELDNLVKNSKLTEEDAEKLSEKIKSDRLKYLKSKGIV